ncbi:CREB-H transcription factor homolog let-607-like [Cylas formicarius]|uniref:CREB-H transcription factor homolog let-607-like n=1 Tax=Cylas formicarius TaxID=197179 RepID=UPI00295862D4|nr:CREB-H transcription factor homolog let-607-like [Cylas formicarius]
MDIEDTLYSSGEEGTSNMDNMDILLNCDETELMTSDFFDSVLSLENNLEEDTFFTNLDEDVNILNDNSQSDGVLSPQSYCSESDKNSTYSTENIDESTSTINSIDGFDDPIFLSLLDPASSQQMESKNIPVIKSSPITTLQKPTKILIQNPSNKKFIAKPILSAAHLKKQPPNSKAQILKVQQFSNNGRPVLLPLSVKSIKILNSASDIASLGTINRRKVESVQATSSADEDDTHVVSSTNNQYPLLNLTNEEKRLLAKEGIQLPTHHPLTKNEERELKRIRRKIRNKISAQDSRKRKKEYVDGLEERVKRGSEENKNLLQRVKELQRQNRNLIAHVNRLQALICNSTTSKATPSTCLMVVLLSALLVSLPNMRLFENKQMSTDSEQVSIRRSLLSSQQATEDDLNMEEFLIFKDDESEVDAKFGEDVLDIENSTDKEFSKILEEMGKKYNDFLAEKNQSENIFGSMFQTVKNFLDRKKPEFFEKKPPDYGGTYINKRGFIEPDVDDCSAKEESPPLKRVRYVTEGFKGEHVVSTLVKNCGNDQVKQ